MCGRADTSVTPISIVITGCFHLRHFDCHSRKVTVIIINSKNNGPFYSNIPVSHDSATVRQHEQYQDPESLTSYCDVSKCFQWRAFISLHIMYGFIWTGFSFQFKSLVWGIWHESQCQSLVEAVVMLGCVLHHQPCCHLDTDLHRAVNIAQY